MTRLGSLSFLALAFVVAACGGGSDQPDAFISFWDAPPPTARRRPTRSASRPAHQVRPGMAGCVYHRAGPLRRL
jgi:hypothetical protein